MEAARKPDFGRPERMDRCVSGRVCLTCRCNRRHSGSQVFSARQGSCEVSCLVEGKGGRPFQDSSPAIHTCRIYPLVIMMRMTVLASGSKGNGTVIATSRTRVLVDAGLSCRELLRRMAQAGEDPYKLDAILITHEHQDHIAGLTVLARRLKIPVFFTEPTHRAWVRMLTPRTTMTYAKWLDHVQREKEARAASIAANTTTPGLAAQVAAQAEAIAN